MRKPLLAAILLPLFTACFGDDLRLYEAPEASSQDSQPPDGSPGFDVSLPDSTPSLSDRPSDVPTAAAEPDAAPLDAPAQDAPSLAPDALCGAPDDPRNCGTCGHDCSRLPNVRSSAAVRCELGKCVVPDVACVDGYGNCNTANPDDGCETNLARPESCGSCTAKCTGTNGLCANTGSAFKCVSSCMSPSPDNCGTRCTSLQTDAQNCGSCGHDCARLPNVRPGAPVQCEGGKCVVPDSSCIDGYGNCTSANSDDGCETKLTDPGACGACATKCMGTTPVCANVNSSYRCVSTCGAADGVCPEGCTSDKDPDCKLASGTACGSGTQCSSGYCSAGICCSEACTTPCHSCSALETGAANGVCALARIGTNPGGRCLSMDPSTCGTDGTCNASGACRKYGAEQTCGAARCASGQAVGIGHCNSQGSCADGVSTPCGDFACVGASCRTTCSSGSDCAATAYCDTMSVCKAKKPVGVGCATSPECGSNDCSPAGGFCCAKVGTCGAASASNWLKNPRFDAGFQNWTTVLPKLMDDDASGCAGSYSTHMNTTVSQCVNLDGRASYTLRIAARGDLEGCQLDWFLKPDCPLPSDGSNSALYSTGDDLCWTDHAQTVTPLPAGAKSVVVTCWGQVDNLYFGP